jgi:hypothetical protein
MREFSRGAIPVLKKRATFALALRPLKIFSRSCAKQLSLDLDHATHRRSVEKIRFSYATKRSEA